MTLTFDAGTNPDIAQVQVQNKLQLALPLLPQAVQQQGVQVAKSARNFLMVVGFVSEDDSRTRYDLADYLVSNIQDPLSRVTGVGEVQIFGGQYAMRIWLDPSKLTKYRLTPADVRAALQAQNAQVSAGQLGGTPAVPGQGFTAAITAQSRLQTPEEFERILLRTSAQGGEVRLRRRRPGRDRHRGLRLRRPLQGQAGQRHRHQARPRRQRAGDRRRGQGAARRARTLLPARGSSR